eukprot:m.187918 g.187918  ORF g.187918 m.187918 type:complete len:258 (+) comp18515_c0_seq3:364-1137(+)
MAFAPPKKNNKASSRESGARVDVFSDDFVLGNRKPRNRTSSAARNSSRNSTQGATRHVPSHRQPRPESAPTRMVRDFTKVNRQALANGLVTATEQQRYRELNTGWRHPPERRSGRRDRRVSLPANDHVYGKQSAPTENLGDILAYNPGRQWLETRHRELLEENTAAQRRAKSCRIHGPTTTRTVMLRRKDPARIQPDVPPWQLSKFSATASPQVSTFRSPEDRRRALEQHTRYAATKEGSCFSQGLSKNVAGTYRNL